jgi:peptidoglycan-associated lipoprotein
MLIRALAVISTIFILSACSSTKENAAGKNQGADSASSSAIANKYSVDSNDLETFAKIPGSKVGARANDRVFFSFDSAVLTSKAQRTLDKQIGWLKRNSNVDVIVEGHCDERGTREYNLALGERRANAVKQYLVSSGISSGRIQATSFGKERPAVIGSNPAAWAENRRGVTVIK